MDRIDYFVKKLRSIDLPPEQARELGLPEGWQEKIPVGFVRKVVATAERFKEDIKLLTKS
jgi:hypothetical protein